MSQRSHSGPLKFKRQHKNPEENYYATTSFYSDHGTETQLRQIGMNRKADLGKPNLKGIKCQP